MAESTLALYAIGLPALGALAAVVAGWVSWGQATESMAPAARRLLRGRLLVLLSIGWTEILFGLSLFILLLGRVGAVPDARLEWAALAYGVPGMMACFSFAIIYLPGIRHIVRAPADFGRLVVINVLPETAALFGFAAGFLILGPRTSDPGSVPLSVEAARNSALYMISGSFVAPLMAWAMVSVWKFESLDLWKKAIRVGAGINMILLVTFALAFLALRTM